MSSYGEALGEENLKEVYNKIKGLPLNSKKELFNQGWEYACDVDENGEPVDEEENISLSKYLKSYLNEFTLGEDFYTTIHLSRIICFDPDVVAYIYLFSDNSMESKYVNEVLDVYSPLDSFPNENAAILDKCCPSVFNSGSWSKPKKVPDSLIEVLNNVISAEEKVDFSEGYIMHLDQYQGILRLRAYKLEEGVSESLSRTGAEELTKGVLSVFSMPIKEVYFVIKSDDYTGDPNKVIARKNSDGELTLTVY